MTSRLTRPRWWDELLELDGITKIYKEGPTQVHALRSVDLKVDAGEMVAVMGPSGSAKSSLLTIAGTLEDATSGRVRVASEDVAEMGRDERARLRRRSIRTEAARDVAILVATGATRGIRRTLTAATAGGLAGLGALLGTVGAYLAVAALRSSQLASLLPIPLAHVAFVSVGVPVLATLAAWVLTAGQGPTVRRVN